MTKIMIRPPYLQKGDKIIIVAPAGCVNKESVESAIERFTNWGYEVVLGENIYRDYNIFSGTDGERADDLQKALDSEDIRAIICARGGYGSIRILDRLDYSIFQGNPKWIVGFSDISVIHAKLNVLGIETLHADMPKTMLDKSDDASDIKTFRSLLEGDVPEYKFPSDKMNRQGSVEGELVGGNLSVLYSLRGVDLEWSKMNKILFIEDLNENLYHLDRMMQNLKLDGKLEHLKGLIVGDMLNMRDSEPSFGKTAYEIIQDAVKDYDFPVVYNFPAGHSNMNMPIILGAYVKLEVNSNEYSLDFL
ncbi:LD-carboxypeptidase [Marinilabiliaceae bacterium JC040]|nr:LD-carboxypeptidase [Marinilabiliaceae bacterium JC040]